MINAAVSDVRLGRLAGNPELARQHEAWLARQARMVPTAPVPKRPTIEALCGPRPAWMKRARLVYDEPAGPAFTPQFRRVYAFPVGPYNEGQAARIFSQVSFALGVTKEEILGPSRFGYIVAARHMLAYRLRKELDLPYPLIGRLMKRDHTTSMHSVRAYTKRLERQGVEF